MYSKNKEPIYSKQIQRIVAWLWLLDREEIGDLNMREVWKSVAVRTVGLDNPHSLHRAIPIVSFRSRLH